MEPSSLKTSYLVSSSRTLALINPGVKRCAWTLDIGTWKCSISQPFGSLGSVSGDLSLIRSSSALVSRQYDMCPSVILISSWYVSTSLWKECDICQAYKKWSVVVWELGRDKNFNSSGFWLLNDSSFLAVVSVIALAHLIPTHRKQKLCAEQ